MMNNRGHLPAGQGMQGAGDIGPGPGGGAGGGGGQPRRGGGRPHHSQSQHQHQHQQQQQQQQQQHLHHHQQAHYNHQVHQQLYPQHQQMNQQPMYHNPYMPSYGGPPYYPIQPQYPNGVGMAGPGYMSGPMGYPPAPAGYNNRSPPPMQQYMPMPPQAYSRPPQHSPIVASPYQAPPHIPIPAPPHPAAPYVDAFPNPMKAHTPHMSQAPLVYSQPPPIMPLQSPPQESTQLPTPEQPESATYPSAHVPQVPRETSTPTSASASAPVQAPSEVASTYSTADSKTQPGSPAIFLPFRPSLPWLSNPEVPFPTRTPRSRRRRRVLDAGNESVELPQTQHDAAVELATQQAQTETASVVGPGQAQDVPLARTPTLETSMAPKHSGLEQPSTESETASAQDLPSEAGTSTAPTTPSSTQPPQLPASTAATTNATTPTKAVKPPVPRPAVPAIPVVPVLPKTSAKEAKLAPQPEPFQNDDTKSAEDASVSSANAESAGTTVPAVSEPSQEDAQSPPAKPKPSSWAGLFNKRTAANAAPAASGQAEPHGTTDDAADASSGGPSNFGQSTKTSLGEALQAYRVGKPERISFLEPRGLINNGNMCYMNSVLQVLLFCIPFYDFLDQVGNKAAFSFKGETPLIHAMINFQKEFNVIDSASSAEALRKRLKSEQLERYGDQFIPKFVYDAIRKLKRFDTMVRGHQQDAEEFLGFLLEGLHDECAQAMQAMPQSGASKTPDSSLPTPTPSISSKVHDGAESNDIWLEVGPRQRAAITRSSGHSDISSPVTKIFGGQLRSEFKVPGLKPSITLQPYQQLQLDIAAPDTHNIVDAMRQITRAETLHGDFGSPNGKDVRATKTVFIESLPSVLILHLKRFQFDAEKDGTVKIWKKIGYPLDLEIPLESLSRQTRNQLTAEGSGAPRYRLIAAVYHHGNTASGGHYTVDVRRQDGQEWIRIDDTIIRRVRSEDVAEAGAEEKTAKTGLSDGRKDAASGPVANRFGAINDEDAGDDEGWNKVSPTNGHKKHGSAVNGGTAPSPTMAKTVKHLRDNIRDNKVAYLLFYEKI